MLKTQVLLVVFMFLAGCATTPVHINDAKLAPSDRVLAFQSADINKSTLTVIRDEGFIGSACYYGLWINNVLAARLDVAEYAKFHVEPGEILLKISRDPQGSGLCGVEQSNWTQRETIMKPGDKKLLECQLTQTGSSTLVDLIHNTPNGSINSDWLTVR